MRLCKKISTSWGCSMLNKAKKRLMTDVAKGKLTMAQAEELMEPAQDDKNNSEKGIIDDELTAQKKKTQMRKLNPKKKILKKQEMSS